MFAGMRVVLQGSLREPANIEEAEMLSQKIVTGGGSVQMSVTARATHLAFGADDDLDDLDAPAKKRVKKAVKEGKSAVLPSFFAQSRVQGTRVSEREHTLPGIEHADAPAAHAEKESCEKESYNTQESEKGLANFVGALVGRSEISCPLFYVVVLPWLPMVEEDCETAPGVVSAIRHLRSTDVVSLMEPVYDDIYVDEEPIQVLERVPGAA